MKPVIPIVGPDGSVWWNDEQLVPSGTYPAHRKHALPKKEGVEQV